jgi:hypothetical protein
MKNLTQNYEDTHSKRYEFTLELLRKYLNSSDRILSLGSDGQFEEQIILKHPKVEIVLSDWDLRFPFNKSLGIFKLIICLEVIEHLKDRNDEKEDFTSFTHTGIFNALIEANELLENDGLFVITTPNLSSWKSILNLIRGYDPYLYSPHIHEFAPYELTYFLEQAGFEILEITSFDHYQTDLHLGKLKARVLHYVSRVLKANARIFHLRCSTLFVVAKKVSKPREILFETDWWDVKTSELTKSNIKYIRNRS